MPSLVGSLPANLMPTPQIGNLDGMRIRLDCPLCNLFMKRKSEAESGKWTFICPRCRSRFLVNQDPKVRPDVLVGLWAHSAGPTSPDAGPTVSERLAQREEQLRAVLESRERIKAVRDVLLKDKGAPQPPDQEYPHAYD